MRTVLGQPKGNRANHLRLGATEDENELALLAQFMRHDSVASLAKAIAERTGAEAKISSPRPASTCAAPTTDAPREPEPWVPVNPGAGLHH